MEGAARAESLPTGKQRWHDWANTDKQMVYLQSLVEKQHATILNTFNTMLSIILLWTEWSNG